MEKKASKKEFIFIGLILVAALGLFLFQRNSYADVEYATITIEGVEVMSVPLDTNQIFTLDSDPHVSFEVRDGAIAFVENDCPDLVCVNRGFVSSSNPIPAACLPKSILLTVSASAGHDPAAPDNGLDIIVG